MLITRTRPPAGPRHERTTWRLLVEGERVGDAIDLWFNVDYGSSYTYTYAWPAIFSGTLSGDMVMGTCCCTPTVNMATTQRVGRASSTGTDPTRITTARRPAQRSPTTSPASTQRGRMMSGLLALLEVELPAPTASWPVLDVQRALEAVDDMDPASLAATLQLVFPVGRLRDVRPARRAFVADRVAVVWEHVPAGADAEPALQAFLEDLTAISVEPSEVTEVVFVLWCADRGVGSRLASLRTELTHQGRIVRTHPLQLAPPGAPPAS